MPQQPQRSTKGTWHERERDRDTGAAVRDQAYGVVEGRGWPPSPVRADATRSPSSPSSFWCIVGVVTAGDRFADVDNVLTILRLSAVIGVVSIGMTFVIIIGGGIDLSVGAILALASVWATTLATQALAEDFHWIVMVVTAILVGAGCGLVNGIVIAYGRLVAFIATLATPTAARGLAEILANRRTQMQSRDFLSFFSGDVLHPGRWSSSGPWCRSSAGSAQPDDVRPAHLRRRRQRRGRPAGRHPRVPRHTVKLYVLSGVCCGIAAVMMMARTTTGSSDARHALRRQDAIAAVVIGGTLLSAGAARSSAPSSAG